MRPRAIAFASAGAAIRPLTIAFASAGAVLLAGGCAALGTSPIAHTATTRSRLAEAQATHEYPSPPPPPQRAAGGGRTPIAAVRSFATAYINWNAQTVASDMRTLAADSIGQARSSMQLAAAQTAGDYELQRGGITNSGTVEAVAPLAGHSGQYVVVTLEATSASNTNAYQGLRPAWHVTLATVAGPQPGLWVISGWQPES